MNIKDIEFLELEYKNILTIENIINNSERNCIEYFNIPLKEDWKKQDLNPYRYNHIKEKLKEIRNNFLDVLIHLLNEEYPNLPVNKKYFDDSIETFTNQYGHKEDGLKIEFNKVKEIIRMFEENADELSLKDLIKNSLRLIPHKLIWESFNKKKIFKAEEIYTKNKLNLYSGYTYSSPNTENIKYLKKLCSVVLNGEKSSKTDGDALGLYFKYFKNGRVDIEFNMEGGAEKMAKYLETHQNDD